MNVEATIKKYLPQVIHMSLATCAGNKPWICEVHFAYDDGLNLYWCSTPQRRHSQEIAANPHVAGNMVTQHHLGQKVRGVYFEGVAKELEPIDANHPAYKLYCKRFGDRPDLIDDAVRPDGHHFYQVIVSDYYVFDGYDGPSNKYHLPWGKPNKQ
jgi:uncharacterized protein YhbP (UPF0306 family)